MQVILITSTSQLMNCTRWRHGWVWGDRICYIRPMHKPVYKSVPLRSHHGLPLLWLFLDCFLVALHSDFLALHRLLYVITHALLWAFSVWMCWNLSKKKSITYNKLDCNFSLDIWTCSTVGLQLFNSVLGSFNFSNLRCDPLALVIQLAATPAAAATAACSCRPHVFDLSTFKLCMCVYLYLHMYFCL